MINTLAGLFIPILIGYVLVKLKYLDRGINKELKLFVMRVAVPCRIFTSMLTLNLETLKQIFPMTLAFTLLTIVLIIFTFLIIRIKDSRVKAIYIMTIAFGNYGYMGWAVLDGAMGAEGLSRGIFFTTLWWPVIYLGTYIIGKLTRIDSKLNVKSYRLNMIVPSSMLLLGVLFNIFNIPMYTPLLSIITSFGNMTVTLILFSVGLTISLGESLKNIKHAIIPVILRPLLGFLIALVVLKTIGMKDALSIKAVLIESTMPVAVMAVVLGEMLGLNEKLLTSILILSTLFSLITIPITLMVIGL